MLFFTRFKENQISKKDDQEICLLRLVVRVSLKKFGILENVRKK